MGRKHDETHLRIVREASRLFRERGTAAVGVEDVMEAVGLTRGGFYAHFKNKEALVAEAIDLGFEDARTNLFGIPENSGLAWVARAAKRYLSEAHAADVGAGCVVAALGPEIGRHEGPARAAFERGLAGIVEGIRLRLGDADSGRAAALFGSWVGALQLARITSAPAARRGILAAAREASLH
jgi:TetR/AcrR family transcriptional repressor of nem operon